jgi:hypothetical protein
MVDAKYKVRKIDGEKYAKVNDLIKFLNEIIVDSNRPTAEKMLAIELKAEFVSIRQN